MNLRKHFNPSICEEYQGLRVQMNATLTLLNSVYECLMIAEAALKSEQKKKRHVSQDELDSERAANEQLTKELRERNLT